MKTPSINNFLKAAFCTALISISLGLALIVAVHYGWINAKTEGCWVDVLERIIDFFIDILMIIVEVFYLACFLFFCYFSNFDYLYKISKWGLVKCLLGLSIVPLIYSIAMFKVSFLKFSSLAITNAILSYILAFFVAFLLPDHSINHVNKGENERD
jgi:hypothetical protein